MSEHVKIRRDGAVTEILFDRPAKKNALTLAMYEHAADALQEASTAEEVRCVVIASESEHFTAGNDLMDFMSDPPTDESSPVFRFLMALRGCACPVVAAVDGYAIGIGTTMLFHCDLAWAGQGAKFQMPFVDLGLVPEAGSSAMLPTMVGHRKAAELLYFGSFFGAARAKENGIINDVVEGDVLEYVRERAQELTQKPPMALQLTKELLRKTDNEAVEAAMRAEAAMFVRRLQSEEFMEAVAAFQG